MVRENNRLLILHVISMLTSFYFSYHKMFHKIYSSLHILSAWPVPFETDPGTNYRKATILMNCKFITKEKKLLTRNASVLCLELPTNNLDLSQFITRRNITIVRCTFPKRR